MQPVHVADECSVLKNWELDPNTYAADTIGEMKFLVRVLSTKSYESGEDFVPREDNLVYEDYAKLVARRQDFEKSVTDVYNTSSFFPHSLNIYLFFFWVTGAQLLDLRLRFEAA